MKYNFIGFAVREFSQVQIFAKTANFVLQFRFCVSADSVVLPTNFPQQ